MRPPPVCDSCGDPILKEEPVQVILVNVHLSAKVRNEFRMSFMGFPVEHESPAQDRFDMCQECGAMLSLALHQARAQIRVVVAKMGDPV